MLQVFLQFEEAVPHSAVDDGLPVSEFLWPEIRLHFSGQFPNQPLKPACAAEVLQFLRAFYDRYELSQPQRRIWLRHEKKLAELKAESPVKIIAEDVSANRSRRMIRSIGSAASQQPR